MTTIFTNYNTACTEKDNFQMNNCDWLDINEMKDDNKYEKYIKHLTVIIVSVNRLKLLKVKYLTE